MSADCKNIYSRQNPFYAKVKTNFQLTGKGSSKEIRHFEIDISGSGLTYEVGDSLGIFPTNNPYLVDEILNALGFSGAEKVPAPNKNIVSLREALTSHYVITNSDKKLLTFIAEKNPSLAHRILATTPESQQEIDAYCSGREIIDFLLDHPDTKFTPEEFIKCLRKLQPRLYSIASSQKTHPSEVHLTVATVRYQNLERNREGICSTFLADRAEIVPVFIHPSKHFRLPEDPSNHIIMVGPGTGIAPFRAFLHERKISNAPGKNWLFFGNQKASTDFLYREELESWRDEGLLHNLSTAFSRDQVEKIYVQHRMLEAAEELFEWIEQGAYFYVCGDASQMAQSVEQALHHVIEKAGRKSTAEVASYIATLKQSKRYRKDVY